MLGSEPLEAVLGAGLNNTDHEAVRAFIRQLADLGMHILFIYPDSKVPADMRTPTAKNKANREAQAAAQAAGRRDWAIVKAPAGLALATDHKPTLEGYLRRYIQQFSTWRLAERNAGGEICAHGEAVNWTKKAEDAGEIVMTEPAAVNLAVEVGSSSIVVVDCDTAAQVQRWFEVAAPGLSRDLWPAPTVLTPGHVGDGNDPDDPASWSHSDGGHFWFTVPDELIPVLPRHLGAMTWGGDNGFAVLWDRRYVLIPPSTRPEGSYEFLGHVYELPDWLAAEVVKAGQHRVQRAELAGGARTENTDLADLVDQWAAHVSWASILEPMGWTPAPRSDSCGCAVWTAPGEHASKKSATAHDTGCAAGRYSEVNAPLHVWTDHDIEPFDGWVEEHGSTISKLQAVAIINFKGNVGKAMDEMGVTPDLSVDPDIDVKGMDDDLDTTSTGDFELPESEAAARERQNDNGDAPDDGPPLYCPLCDTSEGQFAPDDDGELWHLNDEVAGAHLAVIEETPSSHDAELMADPGMAGVTSTTYAADLSDLPADFGKTTANPSPAGQPITANTSPYPDAVEAPDPDVFDSPQQGVPRMAPFSHWRDMPPPEYVIDGLIEHGGLSCVIGPPNVGKSTVVLDMACHIATGKHWQGRQTLKTRVLYLPGEGLSGAIQRILAWEDSHQLDLSDLILGNGIIQVAAQNEAWGEVAAYIARQRIGMIIFDTFARMSSGLEENSATDVGRAVKRFDKLRELTNAGVCVVHHTAKGSPEIGRGSSALNGALDSELLVRAATWDTDQLRDPQGRMNGHAIEVVTSKQKNAEQLENPIPLMVISYQLPGVERTTALITGPNGNIDPMQGDIVMARPVPEPVVETAIRIRAHVDRLTQQGASRADLLTAVVPDAYTRHRKDAPAYWKQRIAEAVDRGLRYQLIETLTGTPSGARYIPSTTTPDQARALAAAEVVDND